MKSLNRQNLITLFEHSNQCYFLITDLTGRFVYVNPLFAGKTGYDLAELYTISITDTVVIEDKRKCISSIEKCLQSSACTPTAGPLCLRPIQSRSKICWELSLLHNEENKAEALQWIGVEEQKRAEDWLQRSELFYRNLIADSLDGILLTDDKGHISFASASVTRILGFEPGELLAENAFEFLHPDDRELGAAAFFDEVKQNPMSKFINARLRQKSGQWLWCMIRGHNLMENPHIGAILIYFSDDTLRKNAEAALIESEQRFRHLINNMNLGVILVNDNGNIILSNRATGNMFGLSEEKLIGRNILQTSENVIHENGDIFYMEEFPVAVAIRTKKTVSNVVMGIMRSGRSERMWLLVGADPVFDSDGNMIHVISSFTDITEQRLLSRQLADQEIQKQKQLMQATIDAQEKERREVSRELHDNISQYLTTTRLYLEVAKEKADGEMLTMINQAHKGLLDMINEIRNLSQSLVPPALSDIGLVESIQDLCTPLQNTLAFQIEFFYSSFSEASVPDNLKLMLFRIIQEQINNIIRHACANRITITLETGNKMLRLSVADNGKGFDLRSVKRGLGFDNISTRAGLFDGNLRIDSAPGKGCLIEITIPQP